MKRCVRCEKSKRLVLFINTEGRELKQCSACRENGRNRFKTAWKKNRATIEAGIKRWRKENPEHHRAIRKKHRKIYDERHPLKRAAKQKRYRSRNKTKITASARAYQLRRANQMPKWADAAKIAEIYALAAQLRAEGHDVHVEHVVPLKGRLVSGLHVHDNLKIRSAAFNVKKGNTFEP